jgi:hypothetical protein
MVAALSRTFLNNSIQPFALCPVESIDNNPTISIRAWARVEFCKIYNNPEDIDKLAQITIWSNETLQKILEERYKLFLVCLRVYQLPQPIDIPANQVRSSKIGSFIKLHQSLSPTIFSPILDDNIFKQRKHQLANLELPLHPELEKLHDEIAQLATVDSKVKALEFRIKEFLGWTNHSTMTEPNSDLAWIETIVGLGNRSKELDEGKNNWQAGTDFENIVHRSLEFLGFTVDEAHKGGAGGLDFFCSKPYALVGECKAGKGIPSGTTEELIKLGGMRLGTDQFLTSAKIIIGPGKPSTDVLKAAQEWKVSIINPMSLQKLVELEAKYPGSVNLVELKGYLEPGQIDHKIDEYAERILAEIQLRIHIVQTLKEHLERFNSTVDDVHTLFGVYLGSSPPRVLTFQEFHDILIELSSPLTGFLGRRKVSGGSDRFYFLRDMKK